MPVSDISSVRGIGVAVSVSTSTLVAQLLDELLVLHAEALLLVDDEQAEVLELARRPRAAGACRSPRRPRPTRRRDHACLLLGGEEPRQHLDAHRVVRRSARGTSGRAGWRAAWSGTRIATCLPSCTALNAARIATSVLPYPTSPQTRRSIGTGCSMSSFTSSMACSWSGVSSYGNASSISRCHGVSGPKAWPGVAGAGGRGPRAPAAISRTAARTCARGLLPIGAAHAAAATACRRRCSGARRRPGRSGRRACRRRGTRAAGSRARRRRWRGVTISS